MIADGISIMLIPFFIGLVIGDFPKIDLIRKILIAIFLVTGLILSSVNNNIGIIIGLLNFVSLHLIIMSFIRNNFFIRLAASFVALGITAVLVRYFLDFINKIF